MIGYWRGVVFRYAVKAYLLGFVPRYRNRLERRAAR